MKKTNRAIGSGFIPVLLVVISLLTAGCSDSTHSSAATPPRGNHIAEGGSPSVDDIRSIRNKILFDDTSPGIPVLCYHFFRGPTGVFDYLRIFGALFLNLPLLGDYDLWTQSEASLDRQLKYLREEGYESIGLADLTEWQLGRRALPPRSVVITFDDGDRSVLEWAAPVLERYDFNAVVFAVTGRVGEEWSGVTGMTWDELRALQDSGRFVIESHTHALHYKVKTENGMKPVFVALSDGEHEIPGKDWKTFIFEDLKASREAIEKELGREADYLAWPYGFGGTLVDSLAVAAGFKGICSLKSGTVRPHSTLLDRLADSVGDAGVTIIAAGSPARPSYPAADVSMAWDRHEIPRLTITARTSLRGFKRMLAD